MERRDFLSSTIKAGAFTCSAVCFGGVEKLCAASLSINSKETSCEKKVEFSQTWIKRFMEVMDSELDDKTKSKIMEINGQRCYIGSLQERNINPENINKISPQDLVENINKYTGEEAAKFENNIIEFRYVKNPGGLKVEDGFCLCPLVENGPVGLSGTYCHCSIGYVREMFSTYLKQDVEVELLESLKRGGKTCRFKVSINPTNN